MDLNLDHYFKKYEALVSAADTAFDRVKKSACRLCKMRGKMRGLLLCPV